MNDGWGLATDGKVFFGSDGSSTLYQIDPQTFKGFSIQMNFHSFSFTIYVYPKTSYPKMLSSNLSCISWYLHCLIVVAVTKHVIYYKGHQVYNLNELEYINGEVWANVLPVIF